VKTKIALSLIAAALASACAAIPQSREVAQASSPLEAMDDFPATVVWGTTTFSDHAGVPDPRFAVATSGEGGDPNFPPAVIVGMTQFPQQVVQQRSTAQPFPPSAVWVRFGVTKEAADRQLADELAARRLAEGTKAP